MENHICKLGGGERISNAAYSRRTAIARAGFTLVEICVALAIISVSFAAIISAHIKTTERTEWSAYSLAAQAAATQGIEQVRAAQWDPSAPVDELGTTNFTQVAQLDVISGRGPVYATNYVTVTDVSSMPPLRELRTDCVWVLASRRSAKGPFTNTAVTLRAPDQ